MIVAKVVSRYLDRYFWRFSSVLKWALVISTILVNLYDLLDILS
jgi:hypothetical protein